MKRVAILAAGVLALPFVSQAALVTAGELTADMRGTDLNAGSTTWNNNDTTGDSLGNFTTFGGGNVNVASIGGHQALYVAGDGANSLNSANVTPSSMLGSSDGSVEAWLYVPAFLADNTVVAWGSNDSSGQHARTFRYADGGAYNSGMFSAWYQDKNWDEASDLIADEWVHVAWVVSDSGSTVKGYVNGVLETTETLSPTLDTTTASGVSIGARNWGSGSDAYTAYIADLRIHTGSLSDADVLNNYNEGMYAIPEPATLGLLGIFGAGAFIVRRRFML